MLAPCRGSGLGSDRCGGSWAQGGRVPCGAAAADLHALARGPRRSWLPRPWPAAQFFACPAARRRVGSPARYGRPVSSAASDPTRPPRGDAEARATTAEARVDRLRARIGTVLAPVVLIALLLVPMPGLSQEAHRLLAIAAMTVVLWVSEAVPLAIAALLAPALAVAFGVAPAARAFAAFAHPLIFLFLGGFMLAEGLSSQGFDRRAALWLLSRDFIAGSPARAMVAVAATAFVFSMWINNTATTAMLIPIAVGLCASIRHLCPADPAVLARQRRFEEGMLITMAYAASLGGVCTPIGTAPNMIALAQLERFADVRIDFLQWMSFAVPIGAAALLILLILARRRWPPAIDRVEGLSDSVRRELRELGPLRTGERRAVVIFALAVLGWLLPSLLRLVAGAEAEATRWAREALPEGVVALLAASLLFVVPSGDLGPPHKRAAASETIAGSRRERAAKLVAWSQVSRVDWGTLLLLGGGLALGGLTIDTGLAAAIGDLVERWLGDGASTTVVLLVVTGLVIYMTELVSNTATTNMLLPVVIPLATRLGMDPVPVALAVTLAASFAFMLPVSTPPNAIAYGSGHIRMPTMVRFGAWLDLVGLALLVLAAQFLLPAMRFW